MRSMGGNAAVIVGSSSNGPESLSLSLQNFRVGDCRGL